jgi:hypothetical protein
LIAATVFSTEQKRSQQMTVPREAQAAWSIRRPARRPLRPEDRNASAATRPSLTAGDDDHPTFEGNLLGHARTRSMDATRKLRQEGNELAHGQIGSCGEVIASVLRTTTMSDLRAVLNRLQILEDKDALWTLMNRDWAEESMAKLTCA